MLHAEARRVQATRHGHSCRSNGSRGRSRCSSGRRPVLAACDERPAGAARAHAGHRPCQPGGAHGAQGCGHRAGKQARRSARAARQRREDA
jgi:hypothetical protein